MCSLHSQSILQIVAALGELSSKQTDYFLLLLLKLVFKASTFWAPSAVPNLASPLRNVFWGKISCKTVWNRSLVNPSPHRSHIYFPLVLASYQPLFGCLTNFTLLNLHLISHSVSAHLHRKPETQSWVWALPFQSLSLPSTDFSLATLLLLLQQPRVSCLCKVDTLAWGHTWVLSNQHLCDLKHLAHLLRRLIKMFGPSAVGGSSESGASVFPLGFLSRSLTKASRFSSTQPWCLCHKAQLLLACAPWTSLKGCQLSLLLLEKALCWHLSFRVRNARGIAECSTGDSEQCLSFRVFPSLSDAWREAFMAAGFQRAGSRDGVSLEGDL